MRNLLFVTLLAACNGDEGTKDTGTPDGDADTDTDADTDADADTDTDTDADADADADTDSDADTDTSHTGTPDTGGDTGGGPVCVGAPSDLEPYVEARDATGTCTVCTGPIDFAVGLRNPCPNDVQVDIMPQCFISGLSMTHQSGIGMGVGVACPPPGGGVQIAVPANGVYEELFPWGTVDPLGLWQVDATLGTLPVQVQAQTQIDVQ